MKVNRDAQLLSGQQPLLLNALQLSIVLNPTDLFLRAVEMICNEALRYSLDLLLIV